MIKLGKHEWSNSTRVPFKAYISDSRKSNRNKREALRGFLDIQRSPSTIETRNHQ